MISTDKNLYFYSHLVIRLLIKHLYTQLMMLLLMLAFYCKLYASPWQEKVIISLLRLLIHRSGFGLHSASSYIRHILNTLYTYRRFVCMRTMLLFLLCSSFILVIIAPCWQHSLTNACRFHGWVKQNMTPTHYSLTQLWLYFTLWCDALLPEQIRYC